MVPQQPVYLLETFVEKERFQETCHKTANWICVGQTKGTAKRGHDHLVNGLIKDVFLIRLCIVIFLFGVLLLQS
ncbi:MAG: DUF4338 domain-containing protein [Syntrophobacterales bacterium]|nr:DUF4338 domain-containing protein [Syntrophobacterales bacterium]